MLERPTLFNGNLLQGFCVEDETRAALSGTQFLPISKPGDRVQLPAVVEDASKSVLQHYSRCNLKTTSNIIFSLTPVPLLEGEAYVPCAYHDVLKPQNFQAPGWSDVLNNSSTKDGFLQLATKLSIEGLMPRTFNFSVGERPNLDGGRWWVKRCVETSGSVNVTGPHEADVLPSVIEEFVPNERYQIQEHVSGNDFSNQYFCEENGHLHFLGTTEQVIVDNHHVGNRLNHATPDWGGLTHKIATSFVDGGVRGFFGVDFRADGLRAWVTEPNIRVNGSSVPVTLMRRLKLSEMEFRREIKVAARYSFNDVFSAIRDHGLEYCPVRKQGAVVYLWGWYFSNKSVGVVALGNDSNRVLSDVQDVLA